MQLEVTYISEANKQQQRGRETSGKEKSMAANAAFLEWFACDRHFHKLGLQVSDVLVGSIQYSESVSNGLHFAHLLSYDSHVS